MCALSRSICGMMSLVVVVVAVRSEQHLHHEGELKDEAETRLLTPGTIVVGAFLCVCVTEWCVLVPSAEIRCTWSV